MKKAALRAAFFYGMKNKLSVSRFNTISSLS